jgi:hypothetical protein
VILKKGDMFEMWGHCDLFLVTTNSYIRKDGGLVMGRGAAKQLKEKVPESPFKLGSQIGHLKEYCIVTCDDHDTYFHYDQPYGAFQVKRHYAEAADLRLIEESAIMLSRWLASPWEQDSLYVLNFPGIGNGGLKREAVLPVLEKHLGKLHNLWVYEYA